MLGMQLAGSQLGAGRLWGRSVEVLAPHRNRRHRNREEYSRGAQQHERSGDAGVIPKSGRKMPGAPDSAMERVLLKGQEKDECPTHSKTISKSTMRTRTPLEPGLAKSGEVCLQLLKLRWSSHYSGTNNYV